MFLPKNRQTVACHSHKRHHLLTLFPTYMPGVAGGGAPIAIPAKSPEMVTSADVEPAG